MIFSLPLQAESSWQRGVCLTGYDERGVGFEEGPKRQTQILKDILQRRPMQWQGIQPTPYISPPMSKHDSA
jgi:hypothetical protein